MLNDMEKAQVRQFLDSALGARWLEHCLRSFHTLELGKVPMDAYHASLLQKEGWIAAFEFAKKCVQEEPQLPDYGQLQPIDTVTD